MNRLGLLAAFALVVLSLSTLTLYPLVGYPYHEIPDFFAHVGLARSVLNNGVVIPTGSGGYLSFPNLFIFVAELSLLTGAGLLVAAALVSVMFGIMYALMIFLILRLLSGNSVIASVGGFLAIATNASIPFIFFAPAYMNYTILLLVDYLTWRLVREDRRITVLTLPIVLSVLALATGDPIYSAVLVIQIVTLLVLLYSGKWTRNVARRLVLPFSGFSLPIFAYYVYTGNWIVPYAFSYLPHFFSLALSNLFMTLPAQPAAPGSAVFQLWLGVAFWVSRLFYVVIGGTAMLILFRNLVIKGRKLGKVEMAVNSIVFSVVLAAVPYLGVGVGVLGSAVGRFVQVSYPYMCLLFASALFSSRILNPFSKRRLYSSAIITILVLAVVLTYLPLHLLSHNIENKQLVYSAGFFTSYTGGRGRLVYFLPVTAAVQFFTGLELVAGPPPPNLQGPIVNITSAFVPVGAQEVDIVYRAPSVTAMIML